MANKNLFSTNTRTVRPADTLNNAGGAAYSLSDKESLAQLVMTGTFNNTFYVSAQNQLDTIKELLAKLGSSEAEFVAKLAIHARKNGFMKDTPAFLTAWLTSNGPQYFKAVFDRVIDNGKMLRNFVQIMRSGVIGRKSLGSAPKNKVKEWLTQANTMALVRASVGNDPSLADVIKMVHPTPASLEQNALFQWILNGKVGVEEYTHLPKVVKELMSFRSGDTHEVPNVPFELLTSSELSEENWKQIALNAGWHMARMNLNTFERKGILKDMGIVYALANKLSNPEEIRKAKVFPYQIFTTWMNATSAPSPIRDALEKALDYSLQTVPVFDGKTYVFVDVSGSMQSAITGNRGSASSKMRCVDVASLIASSLLRANRNNVEVVMFDTKVHRANLDPNGSVMDNAAIIARFGGGGTSCQLPLQELVRNNKQGNLIIYVSDDESWFTTRKDYYGRNRGTETAEAWAQFKVKNPKAKMVCIDLIPNTTTQVSNDADVLNVGGFSDAVFDVIANFASASGDKDFWIKEIENAVEL